MWAVEQRIEEINRGSVEQAQQLLLDVIECCLPDDEVLHAASFYRAERGKLRRSQVWRDKARPGDDIRVFDWGAIGEDDSR
ncbi:hypothetical protein [Agrobacterium cavarae]|uniref:hypothetical protein n=1 Tax=Agrobacterium cavarae TaxID=2528239 RepID=UPI00289C75BF|nr:hypothetical protein [Agrobacterium cavarae]